MQFVMFDVESNGLVGEGFAVGAVVAETKSCVILEKFEVRGPCEEPVQWVKENVLPQLDAGGLNLTHYSLPSLRSAFWDWLQEKKSEGLPIWGDFGVPVEANFLLACVADNLEKREWHLPYPLHELGTLMLTAGIDPDINREEFVAEMIEGRQVRKHHPTWDSEVAAYGVMKCFNMLRG